MKILVCIAKTPDTTSKISFTDGDTKFNEQGVQFIVNPYDEWYALVRGLELKEQHGGTLTTITVGGADCEPVIRKALAIGADDAVRINGDFDDASVVAGHIAAYANGKNFDMILTGKETIDHNGSSVGGMIAELLDLPYIPLATKLDVEGNLAIISREVKGGDEVVEVSGSFVLSAAKGMAEQRIPNMRGIMAARTKPLEIIEPSAIEAFTQVVKFTLPPAKASCKYVDAENPAELVRLLSEEAKAL